MNISKRLVDLARKFDIRVLRVKKSYRQKNELHWPILFILWFIWLVFVHVIYENVNCLFDFFENS